MTLARTATLLASLLLAWPASAPAQSGESEPPSRPIGRDYATGTGATPTPVATPGPAPPARAATPAPTPRATTPAPPPRAATPSVTTSRAVSGAAPAAVPGTTGRYLIGPEDVVHVQVLGRREFEGTVTVSERGTALFPVLGEVEVTGLTVDELRDRLVVLLKDGYMRSPEVVVDIVEYNNMKVWVFGLVNNPGELRLTGSTTLLQLLTLVGNPRSNAGSTVTIERTKVRKAAGPDGRPIPVSESDTITVDLDALLHQGDLGQNVELQNGDKVYVPPTSSKIYALGEVVKPGFYPYRDGMQLSDLVQMAGGLTEYANPKKVRIRRSGFAKPIQVDFKAFVKEGNLENNVPLQEGDVVIFNSSFLF